MKRQFANFLLVIGLISSAWSAPHPVFQAEIEFRNASVENQYPAGIVFRVEVCGTTSASRLIFNYQEPNFWAWEKDAGTVFEGETADHCDRYRYFLDTQALSVPPFSPIKYFWSVTEASAVMGRSSNYVYSYRDTTYEWNTLEEGKLVIWWHDRPDQFASDVMFVAARAYEDQAEFYSLSLESPITIVMTNTEEEFSAWREEEDNAGGMAFSQVSLTIQLVDDEMAYYQFLYYDWMKDVIPHEISHIYFNHLVKRYSGASFWLDEGMATYNEYSDHWEEWKTVKAAHDAGELRSLEQLDDDFWEDSENIDLAYAESYYAILYMDEVYGQDAIDTLLYEYSRGTGETAAFEKSFGKTPEQFETDFLAWLPKRLETYPPDTNIATPPQSSETADDNEPEILVPGPSSRVLLLSIGLGVCLTLILLLFGVVIFAALVFILSRRSSTQKGNKTNF